jgi:hypothetical protein
VISDGILLYGYISMDGRIIPETEKASTVLMDAFARPLPTSYIFLSSLYAKTFPAFERNWKLVIPALKILVGS